MDDNGLGTASNERTKTSRNQKIGTKLPYIYIYIFIYINLNLLNGENKEK